MERLKQNRTASFIAVTLIYIIAVMVGITLYKTLDLPWWLSLLIADVAATLSHLPLACCLETHRCMTRIGVFSPP